VTAVYSIQSPPVVLYVTKGKNRDTLVEHNKENISVDRACELILAPLLFDDIE
jgi:hypothetical protein